MFSIQGASLDEVWGSSRPSKPSKSSKSSYRKASNPNTKVYDDIIDAYIEDFKVPGETCKETNTKDNKVIRKSVNVLPEESYYDVSPYFDADKSARTHIGHAQKCNAEVMPTPSSDYAEDALEYRRFHKGDHMFFGNSDKPQPTITEEEDIPQVPLNRVATEAEDMTYEERRYPTYEEQQRMMYYEPQAQQPVSLQSQYIELALYIFSGVILIFLLDQILHLGLYIR